MDVNTDIREELATTVVRAGWGLQELQAASLSLEEIFLELTTEEAEVDGEGEPDRAEADGGQDSEGEAR